MSKTLTPEELEAARAKALKDHNRTYNPAPREGPKAGGAVHGMIPHLAAWKRAAAETTKKYLGWTVPAAKAVGHSLAWNYRKLAYRTDERGTRHFSPKRLAIGLTAEMLVLASLRFLAPAAYYYGTFKTYNDIFVPNAGVFVNQQFVHPSQPGRIIAPRDEIFTVLGQHVDEQGKIESIRFDVDSNMYFFYMRNALRPDLAAAKMVPISPYGAMCNVQATGLYTRLPRFFRLNAVKWLDMRPEIVNVKGDCEQLQSVPPQYAQGNAPATPQHMKPLLPAHTLDRK